MKLWNNNILPKDNGKIVNASFPYHGIIGFCGKQGSGKTYSAVKLVMELYDNYNIAIITNMTFTDINMIDDVFRFTNIEDCFDLPVKYDGAIILIDEITNVFNNLDYKIFDSRWFDIINMLRKRHILLIGTCPVFNRINKAFREQFDYFVDCANLHFFRWTFQINEVYESRSVSFFDETQFPFEFLQKNYFWHKRRIYESYNTLELIRKEAIE